jgi:hypothetical protein
MLTGLNVPRIQTSADEMATALGWVINSAYDGALSEEELEQKRAEAMSQVFGAITAVPGVGPTAEWSKFAFDQITTEIGDKIGQTDPTASGDYSELSAEQKLLLEQMIINQMLASGYWDDAYIDEANGGADGDRYQPPPTEAIVPGSDPPRFDFESDAYRDWHRSTFPLGDFLNANIYPPFEEMLTGGLGLPG